MDFIKNIAKVIIEYAPENFFLELLYYCTIGILLLVTFRFILHLVVRLLSWKETRSRPSKHHIDRDYDYINGWRKKPNDRDNHDDGAFKDR